MEDSESAKSPSTSTQRKICHFMFVSISIRFASTHPKTAASAYPAVERCEKVSEESLSFCIILMLFLHLYHLLLGRKSSRRFEVDLTAERLHPCQGFDRNGTHRALNY
jgi:hypothetical protein